MGRKIIKNNNIRFNYLFLHIHPCTFVRIYSECIQLYASYTYK